MNSELETLSNFISNNFTSTLPIIQSPIIFWSNPLALSIERKEENYKRKISPKLKIRGCVGGVVCGRSIDFFLTHMW